MKLVIEFDNVNPRNNAIVNPDNHKKLAEAVYNIFPAETITPVKIKVLDDNFNIYFNINGTVVKR